MGKYDYKIERGFMVIGKVTQEKILANTILSPREIEVAMLVRLNQGRNAIGGILGLSENSVKTILKRIENKLGSGWTKSSDIIWPRYADEHYEDHTSISEATQEGCTVFLHTQDQKYRQFQSRQTSWLLLIKQGKNGRDILHVTSRQRFWLRPVLKDLADKKYLKLLAVDWNEVFQPHWLPIVNKGRKEIRAANYITYDAERVISCLKEYLSYDLPGRIGEVSQKLTKINQATAKQRSKLPSITELTAMCLTDFNLQEKQG